MIVVTCPNCGAKNRVDERQAAARQPICGRCKTPLIVPTPSSSDGHPVEVTDANFNDVLRQAGDRPVLVDFWAAWCGPCKMIAPTIEALARESNGRWVIGKLDTDKNPQTAGQYRINAIPAMLLFKKGQLADQIVGLQPKDAIVQRLNALA